MQLVTPATNELPQITWQMSGLETATGIDTAGVTYIGIPVYNNSGQWIEVEDIDEQSPDYTDPEEYFAYHFPRITGLINQDYLYDQY